MNDLAELARTHRDRLRLSRHRSQHGYTLLEVLLVVAISGMLLGPLFAWMILTMRQQPVQRDGMIISAQAGLLRGHFPRDVTVAGAARTYPANFGTPAYVAPADEATTEWATWRQPCIGSSASGGAGVRHLAVLISQGESRLKTVYSVAPMRNGNTVVAGRSSIWRTQCGANTGTLVKQTQVVEDIDPSATATTASCSPATVADPADACRQIALRVTQRDTGGAARPPILLNATRRTDLASLAADPGGNFLPTARITVVSQTWNGPGTPQTTFQLSAATSSDPDGAALTYRWELPTGPEGSGLPFDTSRTDETVPLVLPAIGVYWVRLTVTDEDGAQNFDYQRFEIQNRVPTAVASVSPLTATAGVTTIQMDGTASSDPDAAAVASHRWRIYSALDEGAGLEWTSNTAIASFPVPAWVVGNLVVELTVADAHGVTSVEAANVNVIDPTAPPETTVPVEEPEPEPGAPVARFVATHVSGTTFAFDATGSDGAALSYSWAFGLLAGTGSGAQLQYTYPGPGTYTATLTVTDDQARTSRRTLEILVPGTPTAPTNVRVENNILMWDPRPGARRYLVDLEATNNGCARAIVNQPVAASAAPQRALPPNPCTGTGTTARARVGVEAAAGVVAWSEWINVPVVVK